MAVRADPGDVHLLGLERRGVHGRGDPRSRTQRAARAALGTAAVIAIYLLINVLYLYVIPIGELATLDGRACSTSSADRLLGAARRRHHGASSRSSASPPASTRWTFAGPRVYFAMARDGVFFKSAARVHPNYKTPAASIVAQAALAHRCWC